MSNPVFLLHLAKLTEGHLAKPLLLSQKSKKATTTYFRVRYRSFSTNWQPHHIEQIALLLAIDSASLQRWHNYNNGKTLRLQTYYCIIEGAPHRAITSHYTPLCPLVSLLPQ